MRIAALVLAIAIVLDIVFWAVAWWWQNYPDQRRWIGEQLSGIPWGFVIFAAVFIGLGFAIFVMSTTFLEGP